MSGIYIHNGTQTDQFIKDLHSAVQILKANMDINNKINLVKSEFEKFNSWEDKYRHIIKKGKSLAEMPEELKKDELKVKGCQSQVWLFAEFDNERQVIHFKADSDASIVKGIIAILLDVYDLASPDEILNVGTHFLDSIGLRQHLSMSRANGLNAMVKQIHIYAMAYKARALM